jgi:hypothetical protein
VKSLVRLWGYKYPVTVDTRCDRDGTKGAEHGN